MLNLAMAMVHCSGVPSRVLCSRVPSRVHCSGVPSSQWYGVCLHLKRSVYLSFGLSSFCMSFGFFFSPQNDADDADDPISCTPAFASSRMANVSPENSSNRILLAASTTDCIASDLSSDNDNGKKSTVGVVCQDLFAASVTLANEGEDCPTKGHEGKVVQEDLNLVPALLPANSDEVVEQSNHLAIAKPGLKHAQLSELDNVKSETVSPSWRMELELAGHAAAGDAKRSCSPVPSESRAKPLERDVLSDDGCSPLENSAKCSPNTNELREVSRSPSAHPLKHHVRVVNTSATYFDVPIAGVHLGDRHVRAFLKLCLL